MESKRITLFAGHYGSGKTNIAVNFAKELKKSGKSIIVSTHIFSLVEKICDRVGIIIDGELAVCQKLDEFMNGMNLEDRFFELYEEKVGGIHA